MAITALAIRHHILGGQARKRVFHTLYREVRAKRSQQRLRGQLTRQAGQRIEPQMATLSPELALLAACCLAEDGELAKSAGQLAQSGLDWERFEHLAGFHGVCGMVGARLTAVSPTTLPQDLAARFRQALRQDAAAQIADTAEAVKLCGMLEGAGIRALVLKGSALAHMLYGPNPEWRGSSDIDILIAEQDLGQADLLLLGEGFMRTDPAILPSAAGRDMYLLLKNVFDYRSPGIGRMIELHIRPMGNPHCVPQCFEELYAQSCLVDTASGPVRGLAGAAFLGYLCWHALGQSDFRLRWLGDLVRMKQLLGAKSCVEAVSAPSNDPVAARAAIRPAAVCDSVLAALASGCCNGPWKRDTAKILRRMEQAKDMPRNRSLARVPLELSILRFKLKLASHRQARGYFLLRAICDPRDVLTHRLSARFAPVYALAGPILALKRFLARSASSGH